jgi:uncharacterized membrane protein
LLLACQIFLQRGNSRFNLSLRVRVQKMKMAVLMLVALSTFALYSRAEETDVLDIDVSKRWLNYDDFSPRVHYMMSCVFARLDDAGEPHLEDLDDPWCIQAKGGRRNV